jgi:hypothetical protein
MVIDSLLDQGQPLLTLESIVNLIHNPGCHGHFLSEKGGFGFG